MNPSHPPFRKGGEHPVLHCQSYLDEPFKRLAEASQDKPYRLLSPEIGKPVVPDDIPQRFRWWEAGAVMKISVTANSSTTVFELNNSPAARDLCAQLH